MRESKEKPIPFTGEMVRAVLADLKIQTRRVVKHEQIVPPQEFRCANGEMVWRWFSGTNTGTIRNPYGRPGDRLWVRERQRVIRVRTVDDVMQIRVRYEADGTESDWLPYPDRLKGCPVVGKFLSYGGYRESSRLILEVTSVRVERLQDITEVDAMGEGIKELVGGYVYEKPEEDAFGESRTPFFADPVRAFEALWDSLNQKRGYSWETNPHVWVVGFKRLGAS